MPGHRRGREREGVTINVVVVDDHSMFAESLLRLLGAEPDIEVLAAEASAGAGIERVVAERPDVVIMDFSLPDMDGATATRRILEQVPEARVIMLTGSEQPGSFAAASQAGCAAWIRKTHAVTDLVGAVRSVARGAAFDSEGAEDLPRRDELVAHFQPVVSLEDGRIVGFESLVRWQREDGSILGPGAFMAVAEQTGFVVEVGRRVVELTVEALSAWRQEVPGGDELRAAVNISARELQRAGLAEELLEAVNSAGVPPSSLVIEVTETVLLGDSSEVLENLHKVGETGMGLSLDDFGTAYSSLEYLLRHPFDHVKLDRSFTSALAPGSRTVALVEAIQRMATSMGALAIAEGVEEPGQRSMLVDAGWTLGQGFLFSPAVPFGETLEMLRSGSI